MTYLRRQFSFMQGNILVLSITGILGNFSRAAVFPYASLYILALGGNAEQIGFVNALAPLTGLLFFPIAGYIADHFGRVRIIVLSALLSGAVTGIFVIAPTWEVIAIASLFRAVAALQFPASSAIIADSLAPEDRGRGIGTMNMVSNILSIFAPLLGGLVVEYYGDNLGLRILYAMMMTLYMLSAWLQLRFLQETKQVEQDDATSATHAQRFQWVQIPTILKQAYRDIFAVIGSLSTPLRALTGVIVLSFMVNGVISPFWVVYAIEEIGLTSASWGLILLLETLIRTVAFLPVGMLVDRWGRTTILAGTLIVALCILPLFIFATGFYSALAIRLVAGVLYAAGIPSTTALMADLVPRENRGRVMASIGQGGIMLGAAGGGTGGPATGFVITIPLMCSFLLGGYLYKWNPVYPWYFAAIALFVSI
ncbi:MAG: MFS transporter, partial [Chloroflexota bacterium]